MQFLACYLLLVIAVPEGDATGELDSAIASIKNQEENTQSFRLEYSYKERQRGFVDPDREDVKEQRVRLLGDGVKRRCEEDVATGTFDASSTTYSIWTFNGKKRFNYTPNERSGGFNSKPPLRFAATFFSHLHGFPDGLASVLVENRENIRPSIVRVNDESLLQLEFTTAAKKDVRLWLNPTAAYQIRRLETKAPELETTHGTVVPTRETQVTKYLQKSSFFFPSDFVTIWKSELNDGTARLIDEMHVTLLDVDPNAKHDPRVFEIEFPNGTRVFDADTELVSIVGQPGSMKRRGRDADEVLAQSGSAEWPLWRILAVGGCAAAACGLTFVWRRRRRKRLLR